MIPALSISNGASADSMRPFSTAGNGFRNTLRGVSGGSGAVSGGPGAVSGGSSAAQAAGPHARAALTTLSYRSLAATVVLLTLATVSSGCVYRMDIQQGNFLEARTVDQLAVGMTRSQVRYLLGTPMVPDAFDKDRWDYLYYFRRGRLHTPYQRHLIVFFKEDKVDKFDKDNVPTAPPEKQPQEQTPQEQAPIEKFPKI
jgi:outer membrane protein assembly factor BamE